MGSLLPQRRGEADPAHGQAGEPESDKIFRCLVLIICMNISVGNSEIPDVEGLTQCGAGKKTARRYMSNTFSQRIWVSDFFNFNL